MRQHRVFSTLWLTCSVYMLPLSVTDSCLTWIWHAIHFLRIFYSAMGKTRKHLSVTWVPGGTYSRLCKPISRAARQLQRRQVKCQVPPPILTNFWTEWGLSCNIKVVGTFLLIYTYMIICVYPIQHPPTPTSTYIYIYIYILCIIIYIYRIYFCETRYIDS